MSNNSAIGMNPVRAAVAAILGTATFVFAAPAFPADGNSEQLEEVQVTGTRIRRTTDFDTANPTTVVDSDYFKNLGIVNVGDAVKSLPSNISNNSPTTTGNANFFAGSTIANLRGLNPFFGSRTLNLVNGRRHVPTNQGDGVDLNFIPTVLIDRIDVVTGGASAAYGSGAISGVNNVFLNRRLEGGKLDVDFGQSMHRDARDQHYAGAFGSSFNDGGGHFVLAFEHQNSAALGCKEVRNWCAAGNGMRQTFAAAGDPTNVVSIQASNLHAASLNVNGVWNLNAANLAAGNQIYTVNDAGTQVLPFARGVGNNNAFNLVSGGDGRHIFEYTNLRAPVLRNVLAGTFNLKLTDSVNLSADASWGRVVTDNRTGALDANFTAVQPDNAYLLLNPGLQPGFASAQLFPGGFAFFNKDWTAQVNSHSRFTTEVKRFSIGLDGKFGDSSWTWDGYFQAGKSDRTQLVADNRHLNAFNFAVDAVFDDRDAALPVAQRRIECRVTQQLRNNSPAAPAAGSNLRLIAQGCVPLNSFGVQPLDKAAKAYAFGFLEENTVVDQKVVALNATGDLFEGFGAGSIKGAVGAEYRREKGSNLGLQDGKPDYVRTDYLIQYGESFGGTVDVFEGYGEVNLPVLRDVQLAKRLELDLAARYSDYKNKGSFGPGAGVSRSHSLFTWKASGFWDPVDQVRVRFSQSRDSRAANFRELYYGQIIQAGGIFGYCGPAGSTQTDPCTWSLEGNVDLKPEKADTTTVGVVLRPTGALDGLEFAADYFQIEIKSAIQQANVRRVLDGCYVSNLPEFCSLITFDSPASTYTFGGRTYPNILKFSSKSFNGSAYKYRGIDFSGSYRLNLGDVGGLTFRLLATRMLEQSFTPVPGQPTVDVIGQTGTANSFLPDNQPSARWRGNLSATYAKGAFSTTLQANYVSSGKFNYLGVTPSDSNFTTAPANYVRMGTNHVPSYVVYGLNGNYTFQDVGFAKTLDVWAGASNLFNKSPPIAVAQNSGGTGGTNPIFFDTIGRYYKLGIRASF